MTHFMQWHFANKNRDSVSIYGHGHTNTHTYVQAHRNKWQTNTHQRNTHNRLGSGHQCHRQKSSEKLFLQRAIHNHLLMAFNYKLHSFNGSRQSCDDSVNCDIAISNHAAFRMANRLNRIHILITREVTLFSRRKNGNGRNLINLKCGPVLMQSN